MWPNILKCTYNVLNHVSCFALLLVCYTWLLRRVESIQKSYINRMKHYKEMYFLLTYACMSSGIFHPLICDRRKSATETSKGNSGIHTINLASPEYVPYFTIMVAFEDPLASEPSTYTELHDDET